MKKFSTKCCKGHQAGYKISSVGMLRMQQRIIRLVRGGLRFYRQLSDRFSQTIQRQRKHRKNITDHHHRGMIPG